MAVKLISVLLEAGTKTSMATQEKLVESFEIPPSIYDIYVEASENERTMAQSLNVPLSRTSEILVVQGRGREVIHKIEELSVVRVNLLTIFLGNLGPNFY